MQHPSFTTQMSKIDAKPKTLILKFQTLMQHPSFNTKMSKIDATPKL